jgi:hypothetical protein
MTTLQKQLLDYLTAQAEIYATSRRLYLDPAERAEKVRFYRDAAMEVQRLLAVEADWNAISQILDKTERMDDTR